MTASTSANLQRFTHASHHARKRIAQRCKLDERRLIKMLDQGLCVDLGRKPGCDRRHWLFFSIPDQHAFVALRDDTTGTMVTVLPLDYHETLAWQVTATQIEQARLLAARRTSVLPDLRLNVHYVDSQGALKTTKIWMGRPSGHGGSIEGLFHDRVLRKAWRETLVVLGIALTQIVRLTVREGGSGEPQEVPMSLLNA